MKYTLAHVKEAARMLRHAYTSYIRYDGAPAQICETIVARCWNGTYFQTSSGHFSAFYCRDFGMCAQSLMTLGYHDEVRKTLEWALAIFAKSDTITTTITKDEVPIDCFAYGADSLPYLLHAIKVCADKKLIADYRPFIERQALKYMSIVVDPSTQLVRRNGEFSSMKDHYVRDSSCYDNCMVGWLLKTMEDLGFDLPTETSSRQMRDLILENFWTGTYFLDDLRANPNDNSPASVPAISSDAQIFPFYTGLFDAKRKDARKWILAKAAMRNNSLDDPFPMKYTALRDKSRELFLPSVLAPNYEGTAVWMHLGLCYLTVLARADTKSLKKNLDLYTTLISQHKNFLEVFDASGKPYRSLFYKADDSMVWAAIYLDLISQVQRLQRLE